ncbi:MAG: insulinase family protein, partial [Acidimicrobiia bacterium]|nr:insulinase family protein [Acidimicrobiia bacterium]
MPVFPDDAEVIPTDGDVVIGTLDNGLTYYIRENEAPGGRAQLRLVVNAGSLLEDADQRGGAHYLEHMMFNGTKAYPENELVRVLQRFGSEFGPDINAYTNYDETVYELQVPTDSRATLDTAVDVLYEWASQATIDPTEVELERGVVIEEWRLRSQGFWGRYFDEVDDILLGPTIYAGQDPLGTLGNLESLSSDALRRFYEEWYRPSLMAVVAVGDFDVDRMEESIRNRFGALEDPLGAPSRPLPTTEPLEQPTTLVLVDDELPNAFVELNYPLPVEDPSTIGALR